MLYERQLKWFYCNSNWSRNEKTTEEKIRRLNRRIDEVEARVNGAGSLLFIIRDYTTMTPEEVEQAEAEPRQNNVVYRNFAQGGLKGK